MFQSRDQAIDFRDRIVEELVDLQQTHELLWHVSPGIEGVDVRLRPDESSRILVVERLEEEFKVRDRGETEDGEWRDIEVRPLPQGGNA